MKLRLYHYWRSSCSWRVRWALSYKGIDYEGRAVSLIDGESQSAEHLARSPFGYVPVLEFPESGEFLRESSAILEWLEETHFSNPLLPRSAMDRAKVRELSQIINAGTQPVQNLYTQKYYSNDKQERLNWARHFIERGLSAYEKAISNCAGTFSLGGTLTHADLFLIPQLYNAHRFGVNFAPFPRVAAIEKAALQTPSCKDSHPDRFKP